MGICNDKDIESPEQFIVPRLIVNEHSPLLKNNKINNNTNVINPLNYNINDSVESDSDYIIEDDELYPTEININSYNQCTLDELFDELEEQNDNMIKGDLLKIIINRMSMFTTEEINQVWEQYHMLIFNKIKEYPWVCIELKLNALSQDEKLKYMEKMAVIIYELYPNDAVILLHNSIRKVAILTKKINKRIGDFLLDDNIQQHIMINNAYVALSKHKYGLAYLLFKKAGRCDYANRVIEQKAPNYIKILIN